MDKNENSKTEVKKPPKKRGKIASFFKEAFSELKKVSWPSFSTVFKTTLIVLGVVVVFLVVLLAFDLVLSVGHDALLLKDINPFKSSNITDVIGAIGLWKK